MSNREEALGTGEGAPKPRAARRPNVRAQRAVTDGRHDERGRNDRDDRDDLRTDRESDFLRTFQDSLHQSVLPDLPTIPGYHVCWLTTSNPRDSIQFRERLGYELIRLEDFKGWKGASLKTGDYAGVIGINEMVAAKIPLDRYNAYMQMVHHDMPLQDEEKLRDTTARMKEKAEAMGSVVEEGDGTASVVQKARPMPRFDH